MARIVSTSLLFLLLASSASHSAMMSNGYYGTDLAVGSPFRDANGTSGFAISVAVKNGVALVGANREQGSGQAHLYDSSTGAHLQTLVPPDGERGQSFGQAVALSDLFAVVGSSTGTYVYSKNDYSLLHVLPRSRRIEIDAGRAVLASGTWSYVYDLESGEQLAAFNGKATSVDIDDDLLFVGIDRPGFVYVYNWTTGERLFQLQSASIPNNTGFGMSVAADDGRVVVGATAPNKSGDRIVGVAYVYDLTSGELIHRLEDSRFGRNSRFANDIAIDGNIAIVSAYNHGDRLQLAGKFSPEFEFDHGAAFAFDLVSGKELRRFTTLGAQTGGRAYYGSSIDYDGRQIVAGTFGWPKNAYLTAFQVPEPSTLVLVVIGGAGFVWRTRRRQRVDRTLVDL